MIFNRRPRLAALACVLALAACCRTPQPPAKTSGGRRPAPAGVSVMDQAGVNVRLDVYRGLPQVFRTFIVDAPESLPALRKLKRFIEQSPGGPA